MIVASFGGGVNSTAMLIGMVERKEPVDLIVFSDTGGEKPHTYTHNTAFSEWLVAHNMPPIQTTRYKRETLEENCARVKGLPSIAYGFKKCSLKFKVEPQEQFCNNHADCLAAWKRGERITKLVGYDADESHRAARSDAYQATQEGKKPKYTWRYPLIEWDWGREECMAAIDRAGVKQPGKSACFFCPSSKKHEIMELRRVYPDLAARAIAMERNAELTSIKGLGRSFAWADLYAADDAQSKMFPETPVEQDCGCYDGESA
jgi:hypothetical protein